MAEEKMAFNDAANSLLKEKLDPATALTYADKSIENEDRFDNEITSSPAELLQSDEASKLAWITADTANPSQPEPLDRMCEQLPGGLQKPHCVWQICM